MSQESEKNTIEMNKEFIPGAMGERIAYLRKRKKLTQAQVAEQLGISAQAVSKWESGLSCPDIMTLVPLSQVLNVSTDELLGVSLGKMTSSDTSETDRRELEPESLKPENLKPESLPPDTTAAEHRMPDCATADVLNNNAGNPESMDSGYADSESMGTETTASGSMESGSVESGSMESGSMDSRSMDSRSIDLESTNAIPPSSESLNTKPTVSSPTASESSFSESLNSKPIDSKPTDSKPADSKSANPGTEDSAGHNFCLVPQDISSSQAVSSLVVSAGACTTQIKVGEEFSLETIGYQDCDVVSDVIDGVWTVRDATEKSILFSGRNTFGKRKMILTIPKGYYFDSVKLGIGAGTLTGKGIHAGECTLNVGAGQMTMKDFYSTSSKITCGMGDIVIKGEVYGKCSIDCGMGSVRMAICEPDQYGYRASVGMGEVKIGSNRIGGIGGSQTMNAGAANFYQVSCSMGKVSVTFGE